MSENYLVGEKLLSYHGLDKNLNPIKSSRLKEDSFRLGIIKSNVHPVFTSRTNYGESDFILENPFHGFSEKEKLVSPPISSGFKENYEDAKMHIIKKLSEQIQIVEKTNEEKVYSLIVNQLKKLNEEIVEVKNSLKSTLDKI